MTDQYGNSVADSGAVVDLAGSTDVSSVPSSVTLGSNGEATFTASFLPYTGVADTITATSSGLSKATRTTTVESTIASSTSVKIENMSGTQVSQLTAGTEYQLVISADDAYGNAVTTDDAIGLSYSGTGSLSATSPASGGATSPPSSAMLSTSPVDVWASTTGTVTVTATDNSVAAAPSGSASGYVSASTLAGFDFFASGGTNATSNDVTWSANTPMAMTISPVDAYGNKTVTGTVYTVGLTAPDSTGGFRTSTTGSNVTNVTLSAGSAGTTVYFIDSAASSSSGSKFAQPDWVSYSTLSTTSGGTLKFNASSSGTWAATAGTTSGSGSSFSWTAPTSGSGTATLTFTPTTGAKVTLTLSY